MTYYNEDTLALQQHLIGHRVIDVQTENGEYGTCVAIRLDNQTIVHINAQDDCCSQWEPHLNEIDLIGSIVTSVQSNANVDMYGSVEPYTITLLGGNRKLAEINVYGCAGSGCYVEGTKVTVTKIDTGVTD